MRKANIILAGIALLAVACKGIKHGDSMPGFTREIPTNFIGSNADVFYQLAKDRQKVLGLDSLENGFRDIQIRI